MLSKSLRLQARQLKALRATQDVAEAELRVSLCEHLDGSIAKDTASTLGVSQQFLCDIRKGRRAISDAFLERLCK